MWLNRWLLKTFNKYMQKLHTLPCETEWYMTRCDTFPWKRSHDEEVKRRMRTKEKKKKLIVSCISRNPLPQKEKLKKNFRQKIFHFFSPQSPLPLLARLVLRMQCVVLRFYNNLFISASYGYLTSACEHCHTHTIWGDQWVSNSIKFALAENQTMNCKDCHNTKSIIDHQQVHCQAV